MRDAEFGLRTRLLAMDEEAIRRELEAMYRSRYMPLHTEALRVAAMSDEEYLAMVEENLAKNRELFERLSPGVKEAALKRRAPRFADIREVEDMVQREVDKVLPFLVQNRQVSGAEGPVSEAEAHAAAMDATKAQRSRLAGFMRERLAETAEAGKASRLQLMLENLEASEADFDGLRDDVTEENFNAVHERLLARSQEMFGKILKTRNLPE